MASQGEKQRSSTIRNIIGCAAGLGTFQQHSFALASNFDICPVHFIELLIAQPNLGLELDVGVVRFGHTFHRCKIRERQNGKCHLALPQKGGREAMMPPEDDT